MRNKIIIGSIIGIIGVGFIGLLLMKSSTEIKDKKVKVVVTIYPLEYLVSKVGGDRVNVETIVPAGAEPHDFEPTAQDLARLTDSDLVLMMGGGLDSWVDGLRSDIKKKGVELLVASDLLSSSLSLIETDEQIDPHIWLSPMNMSQLADSISAALIVGDPAGKDQYEAGLSNLKADLASLNQAYQVGLKDCSLQQFITSHAAFSYLAKDYGLEQLAIAGLAPEAEPTPRQLAELARQAKDKGINYIFFETMVSPKLAKTLADEVGAATLVLNPLESLTQKERETGSDYLSEMLNNLNNLRLALDCR